MVLGSALMAALGDRSSLLPIYFLGVFASALALFATGFSPTFVFALVALVVVGAANGVDNVITDTILQKSVPDALLGRVFSVRFLSFGVAEVLAYPLGGAVVDASGPRAIYVLAGGATAVAGLLVLLLLVANPTRHRRRDH
jgi:MFS family permease